MPQGPQDMCGLTSYELAMMVHEAGIAGAKGFDFVEIYPETNSLQTASHVGCWMALYFLNGLAARKAQKNI
jgi:agmatinase